MLRSTCLSVICGIMLLATCLGAEARGCFSFSVGSPCYVMSPAPAAEFIPGHWEYMGYDVCHCHPRYVWVPGHFISVYAGPYYQPAPYYYPAAPCYYGFGPSYSASYVFPCHHHRRHCCY